MIAERIAVLKINYMTQEQYDRGKSNGTLDQNAIYLTPEGENITQDELNDAVNEALRRAKESGEFNGEDGSDATVTKENIVQALEYTPANEDNIPSKTETWEFTLEDGTTVTKEVYVG